MAVKTYRLGAGQDGNYGALFEADQTAASRTDGWTVAKLASGNQSDFDAATKQVSGSFAVSAKPASFLTGTTANAFKTPAALVGTFAATSWTCSFVVRAGTASAQAGRVRMRVFKSKNADGSAATELTGATQVGTTSAALSTTVDATSTVTWSPGATIRLDNEFLFFVIAWEITTASGSNSGDVLFRTGQVAAGTRVVTPDFVANAQLFGTVALSISFTQSIQARRKTFGQISLPMNVFINTDGIRLGATLYGSLALPITFGASSSGSREVLGQLAFPITFLKDTQAQRKTFGQLLSPFLFSKDVRAQRKTFGQTAFPINVSIATSGMRPGLTFFGALALPITFTKDVRGQRKAFGQTAFPIIFTKDVKGVRKTFGQITFPIIFTKEAVGRKNVFGQLAMQTLFGKEVAGGRRTFSQVALPIIFLKDVRGQKKTFGRVALPVNVTIVVAGYGWVGPKTFYGQIAMPLTFSKEVIARRKTFGQVTAPFIFGSAAQAQRKTFGQFTVPLNFDVVVKSGRIGSHGRIIFPIIVGFLTAGNIKLIGIILNDALNLYLGEEDVVAVYVGSERVWG